MLNNQFALERSIDLLRAVDHPLRLAILGIIATKGPIRVNDILAELQLNQALTSQQLKILRDVSLITSQKNKTEVLYSVNQKKLENLKSALAAFGG